MDAKEVKMPSGAVLKIWPAPFAEARALYQAVLEEAKALKFSSQDEMAALYKDLFCIGFSSKKIESCLWACFKKVHYVGEKGELKIDQDTFEPVKAREDYIAACMAVAKENIDPFVKGLYAEYKTLFAIIVDDPK
jgi:hypothetical protein